MSLLVDTPVLLELRKGPRCDARVRAFFEATEEDLYLSVLTLGELRAGVERLRARDSKAARLWDRWLHQIATDHGERVLPVDEAVVEEWGVLLSSGPCPMREGLLAATALAYDLELLTRASPALDALGVRVIDPFAG
ncbi:MAG: type II toxin-antitoxin system VapC family toxin [Polyangiaceae bacterium]